MNKKLKNTFILLGVGLLAVSLVPTISAEDSISIVCTNTILADFTSEITKNISSNVTIDYIMPAGACPAHFDTRPSDVSKIINADVIISLGWEPWLEGLINKSGKTSVDEIKCSNLGEWNVPKRAITYVECIQNGLSTIFPAYENIFASNADEYINLITITSEQLKETIQEQGLADRQIIAMAWQQEFLTGLGLNVTKSYGPPEGLSVQDELSVLSAATEYDISVIVDNLQSGIDFGARISEETGIVQVIFTNFPGAFPNTDSYIDMLIYNTNELIKGIQNYDSTTEQVRDLSNQLSTMTMQRNASLVFVAIFGALAIMFYVLFKKKQ